MRSRPRRASSENPASPRMVGLGGHWAGSIGSRRADASNRGYPGGLVIEGVTKSPAGRRLEHRALSCQRQLCAGRHVDIKLRYDVPGPQMNLSFLKICDLQQLAIPDPGLCQLSLGLGRGSGIATRLIDLEEPIVGPAIRGGALERALELILRLGKPAGLQQRGSERLAHRIVPVGWFRVWQGILESR